MSESVIFLDLDGPIFDKGKPISEAIQCLTELVKMTQASIVITSSWRIGTTLDQLKSRLNGIPGFPSLSVVGMTDVIYYHELEISRGAEIDIYLREHPEIKKYVIIDDEEIVLLNQLPNFVQPGIQGFHGQYFRDALKLLG